MELWGAGPERDHRGAGLPRDVCIVLFAETSRCGEHGRERERERELKIEVAELSALKGSVLCLAVRQQTASDQGFSVQVCRQAQTPCSDFNFEWGTREHMAVSRADLERLERRLNQAEKAIQLQAGHIQELQATVDALQLGSHGSHGGHGSYATSATSRVTARGGSLSSGPLTGSSFPRERSRTPTPVITPAYQRSAAANGYGKGHAPMAENRHGHGGLGRESLESFDETEILVEDFAQANALDAKCKDALLSQAPEVQRAVVAQGPAEGRNPSAMVMGRIAKAQKDLGAFGEVPMPPVDGLLDQLEGFIAENALDEMCAESLRNQSPECQAAVLNQGPASGRNASAMVMGRIAKFQRGG